VSDYLSLADAAAAYPAFGVRFFRRLVAEKRIRYFKAGGKVILRRGDIEEFIETGRVEPMVALATRPARATAPATTGGRNEQRASASAAQRKEGRNVHGNP
jgi:excisionase family DNA binding protein